MKIVGSYTDLTSRLSGVASNEPINIARIEIITHAREKGANICTNRTPNATITVCTINTIVP